MWSPSHPGLPGKEGSHSSRSVVKRFGREPGLRGVGSLLEKGPGSSRSQWGPQEARASPQCSRVRNLSGLLAVEPTHDGTGSSHATSSRPHTVPCPTPGCKEMSTRASLASSPLGGSRNLRPCGDRQAAGVLFLTKDGSVDSSGRLHLLLVRALVSMHWQGKSFASQWKLKNNR